MARKRTISANLALLAGQTPATGEHGSNLAQIRGLQSLDYAWNNPKEDVQVYGIAAPIARESVESPDVTLDFSYLIQGVENEANMGLQFVGHPYPILHLILSEPNDYEEKNYFVFVAPDGQDAVGLNGASSGIAVLGIGNGFINSYSVEGSVGNFAVATVQVAGTNMKTYTGGVSQPIPAINPTTGLELTGFSFTIPTLTRLQELGTNVIKPGGIVLDISQAGGIIHNYTSICAQSFNVSFDLNRTPINCLGSKFATSRSITFPVNFNFEVEMLARDVQTGSLAQYLCQTGTYQAYLSLREVNCTGGYVEYFGMYLKGISLEGQAWSSSLGGDPQTVRTTWVGQVSSATDLTNNIFLSGQVIY